MSFTQPDEPSIDADGPLEQAARWLVRVRSESTSVEELAEFRRWLEQDPRNAQAYRQVSATWNIVGEQAASPEVGSLMHDLRPRPSKARFMALAATLIVAVVGAFAWLQLERGTVYSTERGERRVLNLQDGSVVTLDAMSSIEVSYRADERHIELGHGQARFDVTRDTARPFRVKAAHRTVMALGTQFNVERVDDRVLVTTIEGRISVSGASATVELAAGEGLDARDNGESTVLPRVDIERATAWQHGKVIFDEEPLAQAAERMNRYGQVRIEVDPSVAALRVNGVFNAGDSAAFVDALSSYFPVTVERIGTTELRLTAKR